MKNREFASIALAALFGVAAVGCDENGSATKQLTAKSAGKGLAIDPTKGTWVGSAGARGNFRADGSVRFEGWPVDGSWKAVGPYTVALRDGAGKECTLTFTEDARHVLWVFSDGQVGWAKAE